jgi:hypothetical protein
LEGGPRWVPGKTGPALGFDGVDDLVRLPTGQVVETGDRFTLAFWVKPEELPAINSPRFLARLGVWDIKLNSRYPQLTTSAGHSQPAYQVVWDQWQHVAVTYDQGQTVWYVNGQRQALRADKMARGRILPTPDRGLLLGSTGVNFAKGVLDEVRVYNRVLSAGEVAGLVRVNAAPQVSAGADHTITLPATARLAGTVTDDGLPNPPGRLTTAWAKASGPGTVVFGNPAAVETTAGFSAAGTYVLRLSAFDGALPARDEVTVMVQPAAVRVLTIAVDADARVEARNPAENFGDGRLVIDGTPHIESYLRFRVPAGSGPVTRARLRLYVVRGTPARPQVFATRPTWQESQVTWNTRPARTSGVLATLAPSTTGIWLEVDLPAGVVSGPGVYSFALATNQAEALWLSSREKGAGGVRPAELVLEVP